MDTATEQGDEPMDRRARKRAARRDHLLDLAAELVERDGVTGLTMAALADAADYAPASLYTYFSSRSALVAALQARALRTLGAVGEAELAGWNAHLAGLSSPPDPAVGALALLWGFSDLFLSAPVRHPREFRLQQQLLVTPELEDAADAVEVVPVAMHVLDLPRRLLAHAVELGALAPRRAATDPIDQPVDGAFVRTIAWVVALNGALLADDLPTGVPSTGTTLGAELTQALLVGWGADPAALAAARAIASSFATGPDAIDPAHAP